MTRSSGGLSERFKFEVRGSVVKKFEVLKFEVDR